MLHEMLGRGAMGQVYRASMRDAETPVAVKLLKPELVSDPELVARFIQERSILTSISHPNVVQIRDLVVEGNTLAIVMEYVAGQDLRQHLRRRGTLPPAEAVGLTQQILHGVGAVHAARIVHRDIKPENLLLDTSGGHPVIKLTDFGIARLSYGSSMTKRTSLIGTPEYMAPELADGGTVTPAADLYSIGILLYEMLSGETPFTGGHPLAVLRRHVDQPPAPIPGIPRELWDYLDGLLAKDPRSRPRSAANAAVMLVPLQPRLAGLAALSPIPARRPAAAVTPVPAKTPYPTSSPSPATSRPWATTPPSSTIWPTTPGTETQGRPMTAFLAADTGETLTRWRDRGHGPDQDGTPVPGREGPPADVPALRRARPPRGVGSRPAVLALPAAVVILAAAIGFLTLRPHSTASASASSPAVPYVFAAEKYPNGLTIVRRWTLSGRDGSQLTETVTASSSGSAATQLPFEEVIPTAIASSLKTVHFTPAPDKILQADPVVEWQLHLPAKHRTITVGYRAIVPATGLSVDRLRQWATDLNAGAAQLRVPTPTIIKLSSLSVSPSTVNLTGGSTAQLALSGQLATGSPAPAQILSGAGWTTGDAAVATVSSIGVVTAVGAGQTTLTAQIGSVTATATVTVTQSLPEAGGNGGGSPGSASSNQGNTSTKKTKPTPQNPPSTASGGGPPKISNPTQTASTGAGVTTYAEIAGLPTTTWSNPATAGGTAGATITSGETVEVTCKVVGLQEVEGNAYWYEIASSPWNNAFYAPSNNFYSNGQTSGPINETVQVDPNVPNCS
jgi:serine/threonine protein kinase